MWKIALAAMLLATSAFGAVTLTAPAEVAVAGATTNIPAGSTFSFNVMLNAAGSDNLNGISMFAIADVANAIQLTKREIVAPTITDATKTDAQLGLPLTLPTAKDPMKDLGTTSSGPAIADYNGIYETLTFATTAAVPIGTKVSLVGVGWGDLDFGWTNVSNAAVTLVAVPEPASMLLLAVGAAFFARRRRA